TGSHKPCPKADGRLDFLATVADQELAFSVSTAPISGFTGLYPAKRNEYLIYLLLAEEVSAARYIVSTSY
ncbi:MAG: hypothetical protein VX910_06550, partial [Candidatus Latescibacterota bacterium]|nr:hypothetical protein [Candidatus Latescibacterota bacterium]